AGLLSRSRAGSLQLSLSRRTLLTISRAELTDRLDRFLAALPARNRDAAGFAPDARYTENGVALPLGEGLWATADELGTYRHDFLDPASGQAACFATVREGRTRSIFSARIKLEGDGISEAEVVIARPDL